MRRIKFSQKCKNMQNLIKKKKLLVSDQMPKKWFAVDSVKQLKSLRKFY